MTVLLARFCLVIVMSEICQSLLLSNFHQRNTKLCLTEGTERTHTCIYYRSLSFFSPFMAMYDRYILQHTVVVTPLSLGLTVIYKIPLLKTYSSVIAGIHYDETNYRM